MQQQANPQLQMEKETMRTMGTGVTLKPGSKKTGLLFNDNLDIDVVKKAVRALQKIQSVLAGPAGGAASPRTPRLGSASKQKPEERKEEPLLSKNIGVKSSDAETLRSLHAQIQRAATRASKAAPKKGAQQTGPQDVLLESQKAAIREKFGGKPGAKPSAQTPLVTNLPASKPPAKKPSKEPAAAKTAPAKLSKTKTKTKTKNEKVPDVLTVGATDLSLTPVSRPQPPVPSLSYGLDRVLFNPGVYHLQDPRSRVYNFDPYLAGIMPVKEFDFGALRQYITSSKDRTLASVAAEYGKKYAGSTSSMTSMLSQFHFLLSAWRPINPAHVSRTFPVEFETFTGITRAPAAIFLHYQDGTYAIDADKEFDTANVLSMLGKSMEKLLTLPKEDFEKYRRVNSDQLTDEERNSDESYHYTTMGDFMMRSQLDAYDPRVPGTGMFDLKTRAVVSIRMDAQDYHSGVGYEIRGRYGEFESYEREYYDMIRSAFMKYSLQVRMGRMDGIFVAFHNTRRIFGFQYISLPEMDLALHGTEDLSTGDNEFKLSLHLLNKLLDKATERYPKQSLRLHFETRPTDPPFMYVFAKPVTSGQIETVQNKNKAEVEKFERALQGLINDEIETTEESRPAQVEVQEEEEIKAEENVEKEDEETSLEVWADMRQKVEDVLENDELGANFVRDALEDALEESGLLRTKSEEEKQRYLDALMEAVISGVEADDVDAHVGDDGNRTTGVLSISGEDGTLEERAAPKTEATEGELDGRIWTQEPEPEKTEQSSDEVGTASDAEAADQTALPDQVATAEEPPLKDLIVRLAARYQAGLSTQETPQESTEDELEHWQRLRKFEEILDELVKTREPDEGPEGPSTTASSEPAKGEDLLIDPVDTIQPGGEVLGMVLTVRNKINGHYHQRPENLSGGSTWEVEYTIDELSNERANKIYAQLIERRRKALINKKDDPRAWDRGYKMKLKELSQAGHVFRMEENDMAKTRPVHVYGSAEKLRWEDVFTEDGEPLAPEQVGK